MHHLKISSTLIYFYAQLLHLESILNPNGVSGTRSLTFELYSLDIPKLSDASPLKIKSDTEQYIYDLISYFNLGSAQQTEWINLSTLFQ
jgi:hypothetical protein